jgi:nucleotide-binding universal stress UspA family protein
MSGIIVGVDGSAYSGRALEWAMNEAALRRAPLTVVTVYPAVLGYLGSAVGDPEDQARAERARRRDLWPWHQAALYRTYRTFERN